MKMESKNALAKDIMSTEVISVAPTDEVEKATRLLLEHGISGLPVVNEEKKVVGIISEGDIVLQQKKVDLPNYTVILNAVLYLESPQRFFDELKRTIAFSVEELMTKEVYTVDSQATIEEISTIMVEKSINRLPVVDSEQKLVGIITRQDIIKAMHNH